MAGLGIQIHAIIQDLAQLEGLYDKSWSTFIANSGVIQVFNTRDWKTAEYVSKMLGSTTQTLRSTSYSNSHGPGGGSSSSSVNFGLTARPLVFPDELMRMDRDAQILFIENANPVLADKLRWYNDPELKTLGRNLREEPPVLAAPVPQQSPKSQPTPWAFAAPTLNYAPKKKDDAPKTDDFGA
ncbi:type IV secretory system conjugative DNA transfer family protein [Sphingorhabdus sp.]|uniref:type IV secretory system conjugative DNA transfer family protein n=1 Tax=Sphingorhabdus sp. TaxID=1902408 RepID=UPI002B8533FD|nr:type IV secretory system conjugative DNA transfer family protein [Sphingorhabdus sp.]HMT42781.1 type IV secretory system conjugative DNA transfer family protein [Sphingorhabdus sp.]